MVELKVRVQDRVATNLTPEIKIVCRNDGYRVRFEFDEVWDESHSKVGLFIYNGGVYKQPFTGDICEIPPLENTEVLHIGVTSTDKSGLHTSTPARVGCVLSADDIANGEEIPAPTQSEYEKIIELLNELNIKSGIPYDDLPLMDGEPSAGQENTYARGDHRHPTDENLKAIAQSAEEKANSAVSFANSANKKADNAVSVANKASETASGAQKVAETATETANSATETANVATETANSAKDIANSAKEVADSAKMDAEKALDTANSIDETAKSALELVNTANSNILENAKEIAKNRTDIVSLGLQKQDKLVFDGIYNEQSNPAATVKTVTDKITAIVAGADADFDTLKEISDWLKAHPESVAQINALIQENKTAISNLDALVKLLEANKQNVIDENFSTSSKTVVGAVNEINLATTIAKNAADNATAQANAAISTANEAKTSAQNAENSATTAKENATVATTQAAAAQETANSAQYIANTANATANEARNLSISASQTATNAESTAQLALNSLSTVGRRIGIEKDLTNYRYIISLVDEDGTSLSSIEIDLPLESVVVSGRYDEATHKVILTLNNGSEVEFVITDLAIGLAGKLDKRNEKNVLYGTDANGEQTTYSTDSVGTQVTVGGIKQTSFDADTKVDKVSEPNKVYGTDENGEQKAYNLDEFGSSGGGSIDGSIMEVFLYIDQVPSEIKFGSLGGGHTVDWGDGTVEKFEEDAEDISHRYEVKSNYKVTIYGCENIPYGMFGYQSVNRNEGLQMYMTGVIIPEGITTLPNYAFSNCSYLKTISLPETLTVISQYTFDCCEALSYFVIPDNVVDVGENAFNGCISLTNVVIGRSVRTLGANAFTGCTALKQVEFTSLTSPSFAPWFDEGSVPKILVPREAYDDYYGTSGQYFEYVDANMWLSEKGTDEQGNPISLTYARPQDIEAALGAISENYVPKLDPDGKNSDSYGFVYALNNITGETEKIPYSKRYEAGGYYSSLVQRSSGNIFLPLTGFADNHAVPKKYVDDKATETLANATAKYLHQIPVTLKLSEDVGINATIKVVLPHMEMITDEQTLFNLCQLYYCNVFVKAVFDNFDEPTVTYFYSDHYSPIIKTRVRRYGISPETATTIDKRYISIYDENGALQEYYISSIDGYAPEQLTNS